MSSKSKMVETFAEAFEQLTAVPLPDEAQPRIRQLHRAFTDLRHHDSEQTRMVQELTATLATREKQTVDLRREAEAAIQAAKTNHDRLASKDARIAALEHDVRALAQVVRKRLAPPDHRAEEASSEDDKRLEAIIDQFVAECKPTPKVLKAFHRCGKMILDVGTKDVEEINEQILAYRQLLIGACLRHGPLTLPETVPDDLLDAAEFNVTKSEDGQWIVEVKPATKPTPP